MPSCIARDYRRNGTAVAACARSVAGPTESRTGKDGITELKMSFGENTTHAFIKGDTVIVSNPDDGWQTLDERANSQGRSRGMAVTLRNFKLPATQAAELAADVKDLKTDGDAYSGNLSEERAKALLSFRGGRRGGEPPTISDAKGSVKFWVTDGALTKYELKVTGKVSFNDNDRDVDRTTTTEIKEVGTTKIAVPEDVKKKLS